MVALVGHVPYNCGYVGTHADYPGAGLALAVPPSNCTVAKLYPQLILHRGTVPTLNLAHSRPGFAAKQIFEKGPMLRLGASGKRPFSNICQLVDANRQRTKLCVVMVTQVSSDKWLYIT